MTRRIEKVKEVILRELSQIIRREIDVFSGTLVTVTEIVLSPDLMHAKVKVSIFPDKEAEKILDELSKRAGEFRMLLGKRLQSLNPLPRLEFEFDKRVKDASRVEELVEKLKNEKK